jgi:Ca-activated chloride channel family protein
MPVNHVFQAEFMPKADRYQFIPKLWAGRRIGYLLEDMRKNGETPEVREEVVRLSKKYGIMTPYTAFLAAPEAVRFAAREPQPALDQAVHGNRAFFSTPPPAGPTAPGAGSAEAKGLTAKRDISASKLLQAPSVADLNARSEDEMAAGAGAVSISAADRQFTFLNGSWTDWGLYSSKPPSDTICVKPFSEAYFRLNKIAGMAKLLAVGDRVVFLWRSCVIKIDPSGAEIWNPAWGNLL